MKKKLSMISECRLGNKLNGANAKIRFLLKCFKSGNKRYLLVYLRKTERGSVVVVHEPKICKRTLQ